MINRVMMNQCRSASTLCAETVSDHCHKLIELTTREIPVRPGCPDECEEFILIPIFRRSCGNDLLRQHIQWFFRNRQAVEFTATNTSHQRRAFDQFIAA